MLGTHIPKGAQKAPNLHSSPNCWHDISNNKKNSPHCWLHISIILKMYCSIYPTQRYILKYIYSPTMRPKGTQKLPNLHSSRNYWHDISNTNIYFQLTFIPPIVGSIYSIQIYISTNLYSQTLRPKGAQKLQQYIQPPSVGRIYPIPTRVQLTFIHQIVGCVYPIRYLYF